MKAKPTEHAEGGEAARAEWVDVVIRKVAALRFGSVQIIVHDGHVTQVESLEKTRFTQAREQARPGL